MTLVFPRFMPTVGAIGVLFEPERVDYLSPEAGGRLGAITAGFPRWTMKVDLNAMRMADADVWRAWLAVQRGAGRPFYAFDLDRRTPAYAASGRPWAPAPATWSQAIDGNQVAVLTLGGLKPGQVVSVGDYVGFAWASGGSDTRRALTRAVERGVASAAGSVSVAIEPPIAPVVPAGAAATLRDACCVMRLVTAETKLAGSARGYYAAGSTISAAEDFRS